MRSCKDISELLSRSLDEPLRWRERWSLKLHLMMCHACATLAEQMSFLRAVGSGAADPELPEDAESGEDLQLSGEERERIKAALRSAQGGGGPPG